MVELDPEERGLHFARCEDVLVVTYESGKAEYIRLRVSGKPG